MINTYILYIGSFLLTAFLVSRMPLRIQESRIKNESRFHIKYVIYMLFAALLPIFLSSIRSGIGIDYNTYIRLFENYRNITFLDYTKTLQGYEIGNYFIVKLGYALFGETQGVFALYSILTLLLLVISVDYYSDRISVLHGIMIMFFIFYPGSYNTVRQYLAVAIIVFGYRYIENRSIFKYIICVLIAATFHSTALIMLFAYFLFDVNKKAELQDSRGIISWNSIKSTIKVILLVVAPSLLSWAISILSNIALFSRYFESYDASSYDITPSIILKLPVYIPLVLAYRKNVAKDERNKFYYLLMIIEFELLLTSSIFKWGFRMSYFTIFNQVVLTAYTIRNTKNKSTRYILGLYFIAWYALQFWLLYFVWERDAIVPYTHIFM